MLTGTKPTFEKFEPLVSLIWSILVMTPKGSPFTSRSFGQRFYHSWFLRVGRADFGREKDEQPDVCACRQEVPGRFGRFGDWPISELSFDQQIDFPCESNWVDLNMKPN